MILIILGSLDFQLENTNRRKICRGQKYANIYRLNTKTISSLGAPENLIDRCENVINFGVNSKNTMKRDSSLNVYRQRKISFEDRVVVDGSKTASINQYGAVRGTQKPAMSIITKWEELEPKVTYSLLRTLDQVYMPIFSQFCEIVWQRLFSIVRILQTTALKL